MVAKEIQEKRAQLVVKHNDLIQKAKYNLSCNQQKFVAYLISLIKPTDKELKPYEISIADFCAMCGIDKTYFYTDFREMVDNMDNKSFWIETEEKVFKFRWFSEVEVIKGSGMVRIRLNSNLTKYLIDLRKNFTPYELYNILAFKSKYSIRLYEEFKSYAYQKNIEIDLEELKESLEATHYTNFKDFRKRVLERAIEEINEYTDLSVDYELRKRGRKIVAIDFHIEAKAIAERHAAYKNTINKLDSKRLP